MDAHGTGFQIRDLGLDGDVLRRLAEEVTQQMPILLQARVREHRGGLPTMTADGQHIVGPAPSARGFFIAGGCNVAGRSAAPAIGDLLAAWIADGKPPLDLTPLSITRFPPESHSEEQLRQAAVWQYRHFYGSA